MYAFDFRNKGFRSFISCIYVNVAYLFKYKT